MNGHRVIRAALKGGSPLLLLIIAACAKEGTPPLPHFAIDSARVTISGLSSGAYMAQQVHLAFSKSIAGAALIAGGPAGCAEGTLDIALERCMTPKGAGPDVAVLAATARERATAGKIDPLDGLAGDRVWIFHGTKDPLVAASVTQASADLYTQLSPTVSVQTDFARDTAHLMPTLTAGGDCTALASPYLGKCDFDAAGAIFQHVVGVDKEPAAMAAGKIVTFAQQPFAAADADPRLDDAGFAYVPPQCETGSCGVHVAFHGCEQSFEKVGMAFVEQAGYNRWADAASVVVIYPQTRSSLMPLNPKGCWDWWGYTGADYDTKQGAQIRWVANLLTALGVKI